MGVPGMGGLRYRGAGARAGGPGSATGCQGVCWGVGVRSEAGGGVTAE